MIFFARSYTLLVITGLVPVIHSISVTASGTETAWMPGMNPGMTKKRAVGDWIVRHSHISSPTITVY